MATESIPRQSHLHITEPPFAEIKSKAYARQQQCSEDVIARMWRSGGNVKMKTVSSSPRMDSIVNAVFTAFDYDIKESND